MENTFNNSNQTNFANTSNMGSTFSPFQSSIGLYLVVIMFSYLILFGYSQVFDTNAKSLKQHYNTFAMLILSVTALYKLGNFQNVASSPYFLLSLVAVPLFYEILTSFVSFDGTGNVSNLLALFLLAISISVVSFSIYNVVNVSNEKNVHYIIIFMTILWTLLGFSVGNIKLNNYILFALLSLHARRTSPYSIGLGGVAIGMLIHTISKSKSLSVFKDETNSNCKSTVTTTTTIVDPRSLNSIL